MITNYQERSYNINPHRFVEISQLKDGGYVVQKSASQFWKEKTKSWDEEPSLECAFATIEGALAYIKECLNGDPGGSK